MTGTEAKLNRPSEVIYQIYPSSFFDSEKPGTSKGTGDLRGILYKMPYIRELGVDALWLNPVFKCPDGPEGDGGYAVSNYRAINPHLGTSNDFDYLIKEAHKHTKENPQGLRVYTDFVPCHTANDHDWFKKSRMKEPSARGEFADFYVWNKGKKRDRPDGDQSDRPGDNPHDLILTDQRDKYGRQIPEVPNNWRSVFGGSAWQYDDERGEFYLHHFRASQPSLNLNEPKVQDAVLGEMKYWLDKGVDGFRIDALPFANYDPKLRDNAKRDVHWNKDNPTWEQNWACQDFTSSMCQPQTVEFVAKIRKLMDSYPQEKRKTALGEVVAGPWGGDGSIEQAAQYLDPAKGLHSCYTQSFVDFWNTYPPADRLRNMLKKSAELSPDGGLGDALDNHDFVRFASRMTHGVDQHFHASIVKQLLSLWASLPGSKFLYNGDELGLPQAEKRDFKDGQIVDPEMRELCRTPMPWDSTKPNAGFTKADEPFLPIPDRHLPQAVNIQERQAGSTLKVTRRLLQQRKENLTLSRGKMTVLDQRYEGDPVVAFIRETDDAAAFCAFNMSGRRLNKEKGAAIKLSDYTLSPEVMDKLKLPPEFQFSLEPYSCAHYGLAPGRAEKAEIGMGAAPNPPINGKPKVNGDHPPVIFATDMLIADDHHIERNHKMLLPVLARKGHHFEKGQKAMLSDEALQQLTLVASSIEQKKPHMTPGGSTSCTLRTLKDLLNDGVDIHCMGWAADDEHGTLIKNFLTNSGIKLLTPEWPEGVAPMTATTQLIHHEDGKVTILTHPGTEFQALQKALEQQSTADLLEQSIHDSNIVYMSESTMSKYGLPFTQKLLDSRWRNKKELALSLNTHASFGPTDVEFFQYLIPSANIVVGNDKEFGRVLLSNDEASLPPSQQKQKLVEKVQAAFKTAEENGMFKTEKDGGNGTPLSKFGQVALITRSDKPALLITKDKCEEIPAMYNGQVKEQNHLGAGNAAFAGFLAGYLNGFDHEKSARLAMRMAAEKVHQNGLEPYIRRPRALEYYLDEEQVGGKKWIKQTRSNTGQDATPDPHQKQ